MKIFKTLGYRFNWLKVYFSPFKTIIPRLYVGKVKIGTPYFLPRVWGKDGKAKPKKIGFNFVPMGYKTKWTETDYRHEWNPIWSFVFFKWQVALIFRPEHMTHYWECWLYYSRNTDKNKSVEKRIKQAREEFPCIWSTYENKNKVTTNYWDLVLKRRYAKQKI